MNPDRLAAFPAAWYLFAPTRDLRRGPVSLDLLGRRIVGFRTASGRFGVMDARCPHLGADLGQGAVHGEALTCPFHHWEFGASGRCTRIPAGGPIPPTAAVASYPVEERHGFVFFFNGPRPLYPLPFFPEEAPGEFVASAPVIYDMDYPWYFYGANGFDTQHLGPIHDRNLISEPVLDQPHPCALRIRYRSEIVGTKLADRWLRAVAGREVEVAITAWSATVVLTTAAFARARSWLFFAVQPVTATRSRLLIFAMRPRSRSPLGRLFQPLDLALRRKLIQAFFLEDVRSLKGIHYSTGSMIEADRILVRYLHWVGSLPRNEHHFCDLPAAAPAPDFASLIHGETR